MFNTVILGSTGTGKTEKAKEAYDKAKRCFVFDYQNSGDWNHVPVYDPMVFQNKCRITRSMGYNYHDFMEVVEERYFKKGVTVILEESKGLFPSNQLDQRVNDFLLSCRHNLVNFVFMFHGADQIPPFIMNYCDIVVLKRIDANEDMLKKKFNKQVYECSLECKEDVRKTFVIGVSNKTHGIFFTEYFKGETLQEKLMSGKITEESNDKIKSKNNEI